MDTWEYIGIYLVSFPFLFARVVESVSLVRMLGPDAGDDDIRQALEDAQAWDFVSEKGLDSAVEAGGRNFSGGQRQRLSIARGLVHGGKILILDDSASALDYATDARLRKAIRENTKKENQLRLIQR